LSGPCKHRWIVLIEFDRPPCESSGFSYFLGSIIESPTESFPLYIGHFEK
jgi:hypothetical protein